MIRVLRIAFVLLIGLPMALGESAPVGLSYLLQAHEQLGTNNWSAVLRLTTSDPARPTEDVLVFEFSGALWFYRPIDGTQSLSRHWNNVAAERRQLLQLLQMLDRAYTSYRECGPAELSGLAAATGELPNGCFILSVAESRRVAREKGQIDGCLLSYYVATPEGQRGHTVLCYENGRSTHVYDPAERRTTKVRNLSLQDRALNLAGRIIPAALARGLTKAATIALR